MLSYINEVIVAKKDPDAFTRLNRRDKRPIKRIFLMVARKTLGIGLTDDGKPIRCFEDAWPSHGEIWIQRDPATEALYIIYDGRRIGFRFSGEQRWQCVPGVVITGCVAPYYDPLDIRFVH